MFEGRNGGILILELLSLGMQQLLQFSIFYLERLGVNGVDRR